MSRCITMLKIHDPLASLRRGGDGEVPKEVFISTQCRNHTFGTHDFCRSCLRTKVWRSQSRICAVRACAASPTGGSIENEMDAHLLYPQKEYGKGVYDRMHVVCESCWQRYRVHARHQQYRPDLSWATPELMAEIDREMADWARRMSADHGRWPSAVDVKEWRKNTYRKWSRKIIGRREEAKTGRCEDCQCEAPDYQLVALVEGRMGSLCWVCKENRLWYANQHRLTRRQNGLLGKLRTFYNKIDDYRKVVPISLDVECDIMDAISFLTPRVSPRDKGYRKELLARRRVWVTDWWFGNRCPSCGEETDNNSWVVNWEEDKASCRSCYCNGWSEPFVDSILPFGLGRWEN